MSDSLYTSSGIFIDVVDTEWMQELLPFEDILVNIDFLPTSELGIGSHRASTDQRAWSEHHIESLHIPKAPVYPPFLSSYYLPRI